MLMKNINKDYPKNNNKSIADINDKSKSTAVRLGIEDRVYKIEHRIYNTEHKHKHRI